jgi:hypothetical protein
MEPICARCGESGHTATFHGSCELCGSKEHATERCESPINMREVAEGLMRERAAAARPDLDAIAYSVFSEGIKP